MQRIQCEIHPVLYVMYALLFFTSRQFIFLLYGEDKGICWWEAADQHCIYERCLSFFFLVWLHMNALFFIGLFSHWKLKKKG